MDIKDYAYTCTNSYKVKKEEPITKEEVIETILSFICCGLLIAITGIFCIVL